MAALTEDKIRPSAYPGQGYRANLYSDTADVLYKGAIVAFNSGTDGAIVAAPDDDKVVAGIVMEQTTVTAAGTSVPVLCRSRVWFDFPMATAADDMGLLVICSNDNDLADYAASKVTLGRIVGVRGSGATAQVLVDMAWDAD